MVATMTVRDQRVCTMPCELFNLVIFTGLLSGLHPLTRLEVLRSVASKWLVMFIFVDTLILILHKPRVRRPQKYGSILYCRNGIGKAKQTKNIHAFEGPVKKGILKIKLFT